MGRRNIFVRVVCHIARKFRILQEVWILPWWGSGGVLTAVPLWALDSLVLVVKICSTCVLAVCKIIIPPALKSLHGETVLVTCTGHILGRELALQLAELGATVVCWDSDTRRTESLVDEIRSKDGDCIGFTVDVTAKDQIAAVSTRSRRQLADVSIVVSHCGPVACAPLTHLRADAATKVIEANLMAHLWIIQAFLPSMIERRRGHIVAINSSAGLMPCADMVPFCAAKYGLRGLMESIAEELRLDTWTKNINTTSVYVSSLATVGPPPTHRFVPWCREISAREAAKIIIEGIRKNHKDISIPWFMMYLVAISNLMPYSIRIIFTDFFNFGHRGWFCFC